MLCISRKKHETIRVDGPAVIHIHEIRGQRVAIRVEAPESTNIVRGELVDKWRAKEKTA